MDQCYKIVFTVNSKLAALNTLVPKIPRECCASRFVGAADSLQTREHRVRPIGTERPLPWSTDKAALNGTKRFQRDHHSHKGGQKYLINIR